jgi:hypothetical protein
MRDSRACVSERAAARNPVEVGKERYRRRPGGGGNVIGMRLGRDCMAGMGGGFSILSPEMVPHCTQT